VQRSAALLPWRHNQVLPGKLDDADQLEWYATEALAAGWSRDVLALQIDTHPYRRQVIPAKTTNYKERLPPPQSDMAVQALKEPYIFDIVLDHGDRRERQVEQAMVSNVTKLLLELGAGFAFVGQQYHLEVEGDDFYVDLLFYHLKLRCYVVIELKSTKFKPEYAGKLNFYVSAVDALLKSDADQPTIGILLCRDKRGLVAEFALQDIEKPIGLSEYKLLSELPDEYAELLPSAEDILNRIDIEGEG
jgi:predicted nuclease of restriction endonuclease-like (RecB) superfamily